MSRSRSRPTTFNIIGESSRDIDGEPHNINRDKNRLVKVGEPTPNPLAR